MKQFIKNFIQNYLTPYWKTLVFFSVIGLIGGFFTGLYLLDSYPAEIQEEILSQGLNDVLIGVITAIQSAGYGFFLGVFGIFFAKQVGLWKDETSIEKSPLLVTVILSVLGGLALILPDVFFFGRHIQAVMDSYAVKPTIPYLLATVTYGAVIEEVMLRLFAMSLIAFLIHKFLNKKGTLDATKIYVLANIISALLFAVGHLPTTFLLLGSTPLIIFRCILLNGALGLLFGYLYRKYGLRYAMIAHGGCHVISKLIWILFL